MQALQVTYTGQWLGPVQWAVSEKVGIAGVQINGTNPVTTPSGLWMENSFVYNETGAPLGGLKTLSFPNLAGLTNGSFNPTNLPALTSFSLAALQYVGGAFTPNGMALLTTLSFPLLAYVGGAFQPSTMVSLTSFPLPSLLYVGGNFQPGTMTALNSLSIPLLQYVGGSITINTANNLSVLSMPSLRYVSGSINLSNMALLTTLSATLLSYLSGSISISNLASLSTVSFPSLVNGPAAGSISMNSGNGNISSVTIGTPGVTKSLLGSSINISGQKLDAASVNGLLALLVSLDGNNGTTLWGAGQTLTINGGTNAAPSGQGVADKATLQGRGATVTTN